ncbi:hypothetical protein [Nocardioides sp. B-3]|uniref:hypothetical protein n=1 Tax=Nocardioides sp. B-3 TaxID=2895565 RepID=UPI00300E6C34
MSTSEPTRARAATEEKSGAKRDRERPTAPEPLPLPVVDNHCHLDIADGEWLDTLRSHRPGRVGQRHPHRSDRLRPARAPAGPSLPPPSTPS